MLVASVLERNDCIFFYEAFFGLTEEIEANLAHARKERLFSTRQHSYFSVTHCENSEVQIAVF